MSPKCQICGHELAPNRTASATSLELCGETSLAAAIWDCPKCLAWAVLPTEGPYAEPVPEEEPA